MRKKMIVTFWMCLFLSIACKANEIDQHGCEALITRYVSVLNAITGPNAPPKDELKREVLLSLMVNYFYLKDGEGDVSKKFKGISKSIGKKLDGFDFWLELESYLNLIEAGDQESAASRLMLDGFDENVANEILEKVKQDDFKDLIEWVSSK